MRFQLQSLHGEVIASATRRLKNGWFTLSDGDENLIVNRWEAGRRQRRGTFDDGQGRAKVEYHQKSGAWQGEAVPRHRTVTGWIDGDLSLDESIPVGVAGVFLRLVLGKWFSSLPRVGDWTEMQPEPTGGSGGSGWLGGDGGNGGNGD
jgi:hypothetical protein